MIVQSTAGEGHRTSEFIAERGNPSQTAIFPQPANYRVNPSVRPVTSLANAAHAAPVSPRVSAGVRRT